MLKNKILGITALLGVMVGMLGPGGYAVWAWADSNASQAVTSVYQYDPVRERWIQDKTSIKLPENADGTRPKSSNTVVIRIGQDNPVKQIIVSEALVIGGATQPLLEINGQDAGVGGKLRIGELRFEKVDAQELEIKNTNVVRTTMTNVVAESNELDVDVQVVNVVRIGRGAASSLFIGRGRIDEIESDGINGIIPSRETGVRIDRLRILGPSAGFGSIEKLVIKRSSVFGEIEVKNVEIQDLILTDVSLDRT